MKRAESYLQHDKTSKWDVVTFFVATFPISRSSDIDTGRQDEGAALCVGGVSCFDNCSRRCSQMKNVQGGTSRCGGRTSLSKRIGDTLF